MTEIIKKLLILALISMLLLAFAVACTTNPSTGDKNDDLPPNQPTEGETPDTPEPEPDNDEPEGPVNTYEKTTYSIKDNIDSFKITGRYSVLSSGISWDWSASGIEFNADCTGDVVLDFESDSNVWFRVWVDGTEQGEIYKGVQGKNSMTIASGLAEGVHTVKVVRMTDVKSSRSALCSVTLNGKLEAAPDNNPYFIEFLGDSLTCGTGTLDCPDPNAEGQGGYLYMDATKTFAYILANELHGNCDYSFVSIAGSHLASSDKYENFLDVYKYTNYRRSTSEVWEYQRHPDLVVVNLGTNDKIQGLSSTEFKEKLGTLIDEIREVHGDKVKILFVNNMMMNNYIAHQMSVITEKGDIDAGLYSMVVSTPDRTGAASHTSAAAHKAAADENLAFIEENYIW